MTDGGKDAPIPIRPDLIFEVVELDRVTDSIVELELVPSDDSETLAFLPGQYVLLNDTEYRLAPRSYSVANAPRRDGTLTILVTRVEGGQLSTWVHDELKSGDEVSLEGPYGSFTADPADRSNPALYLAAGSGLAPIRSLLEARLEAKPPCGPATLIFSARTENDVIDGDRLAELSASHPGFRFLRTLTRGGGPPPRGRLPDQLAELCGDLADRDVFIAGAPGFVSACAEAAEAAGAERARIRTEVFFVEPQPWSGTAPERACDDGRSD